MNRFGATATAGLLLLSLAACGTGTKPAAANSSVPLVPTSTPTPTPKADPTATAKTQILAAYAAFIAALDKGYREGGVSYPYEKFMSDAALETIKTQIAFVKGFHQAKVTGAVRLTESRISELALSSKSSTAKVTACINDTMTAVSRKTGKIIARPQGKFTRVDDLKLVKGKWIVFDTSAQPASYGCTK